jgi:hypothetical protein
VAGAVAAVMAVGLVPTSEGEGAIAVMLLVELVCPCRCRGLYGRSIPLLPDAETERENPLGPPAKVGEGAALASWPKVSPVVGVAVDRLRLLVDAPRSG